MRYIFTVFFILIGSFLCGDYKEVAERSVYSAVRALDAVLALAEVDPNFIEAGNADVDHELLPDALALQGERLEKVLLALSEEPIQQGSLPDVSSVCVDASQERPAPVSQRCKNRNRQCWPYTRFVRYDNRKYPKRRVAYRDALEKLKVLVMQWPNTGAMLQALRSGQKRPLAEVLGFFAFANAVTEDVSYADFEQYVPASLVDDPKKVFAHMPMVNIQNDVSSFFKTSMDHLLCLTYSELQHAFKSGVRSLKMGGAQIALPLLFSWEFLIKESLMHCKAEKNLWNTGLKEDGSYAFSIPKNKDIAYLQKSANRDALQLNSEEEYQKAMSDFAGSVAEVRGLIQGHLPTRAGSRSKWLFQVESGLCALDAVPPFNLCLYQTQDPFEVRRKIIRLMVWENAMSNISKILAHKSAGVVNPQNQWDDADWFASWEVPSAVIAQRLGAGWEGIAPYSRVVHRLGLARNKALAVLMFTNTKVLSDKRLMGAMSTSGLSISLGKEEWDCLQWECALEDMLDACDDLIDDLGEERGIRIVMAMLESLSSPKPLSGDYQLVYALDWWRALIGNTTSLFQSVEAAIKSVSGWKAQREILKKKLIEVIEKKADKTYIAISSTNARNITWFVRQCTNDEQEKACIQMAVDVVDFERAGSTMQVALPRIDWPVSRKNLAMYSLPNREDMIEEKEALEPLLTQKENKTALSKPEDFVGVLGSADIETQKALMAEFERKNEKDAPELLAEGGKDSVVSATGEDHPMVELPDSLKHLNNMAEQQAMLDAITAESKRKDKSPASPSRKDRSHNVNLRSGLERTTIRLNKDPLPMLEVAELSQQEVRRIEDLDFLEFEYRAQVLKSLVL